MCETSQARCGFVALIGAPNAGKSTLLNALVGTKISIVSRKVQTTRRPLRGIAIEGDAQIIFVDTPGIFAPRRRLDRAMVNSAWGAAADADVLALLVDSRKGIDAEVEAILARLASRQTVPILVLNKIDLVARPKLLELAAALHAKLAFAETFMISALSGDGIADLKKRLAASMPPGTWLYPEDQISDAPLRSIAAEITREKLFNRLHDELPYQTTIETQQWTDQRDGAARVEQTIYVTCDAHKKIVIGEKGRTIKAIGMAARKDIEAAAEQRIHLFLFVKVRENWQDDPERYREIGIEFPKE
jgi:GTPase